MMVSIILTFETIICDFQGLNKVKKYFLLIYCNDIIEDKNLSEG